MLLACENASSVCHAMQGHMANQPMDAIPNYGGTSAEHAESVRNWGFGKSLPRPKQLVLELDKYVVGQKRAKEVRSLQTHGCLPHESATLHGMVCWSHPPASMYSDECTLCDQYSNVPA